MPDEGAMLNPGPQAGETLAFPEQDMRKRAALLFDRIYVSPGPTERGEIPRELMFWSPDVDKAFEAGLEFDLFYYRAGLTVIAGLAENEPDQLTKEFNELLLQFRKFPDREADILRLLDIIRNRGPVQSISSEAGVLLTEGYSHLHRIVLGCGLPVVPLFQSHVAYDQRVAPGSSIAFEAAIGSIPVLVEKDLSWEQVLEFRKDADAKRKLRALRTWLQTGLSAKSVAEAKEQIERRVDDYEWAIKKHGLRTVIGGLTAVLDSKFLVTAVGVTGIAGLMVGPVWGAIAGGALTISKVSVWLTERRIEKLDVQRGPNSEAALIFEARKLGK
jgi:hypothetical protein